MLEVRVVSGSIGAGKSSILLAIQAQTQYSNNVHVFLEDTDEWQYYLERFYADPDRYMFYFQKEIEGHMHRLTKRLEQLSAEQSTSADNPVVAYVERSPADVLHVFLPLNRARMSAECYESLRYAMSVYAEHPVWTSARYFSVQCPLDVAMERIHKRARVGEERISREYLEKVSDNYREFTRRTRAIVVENHGGANSLQSSASAVMGASIE